MRRYYEEVFGGMKASGLTNQDHKKTDAFLERLGCIQGWRNQSG